MDTSICDSGDMDGDSSDMDSSSATGGVICDISVVTSNSVTEGYCSMEDWQAATSESDGSKTTED